MLKGKCILVGITGGIAAYKICELIRMYKKNGAEVKVICTPNAMNFVTKLTLQNLSQNEVYVQEFDVKEWKPEHISLADEADIMVIAPATANTISKIAQGIADNLLTSVACALSKNGLDVPFFFNRKEEKDHGEGGVFVGYKPVEGEEIVIVEDVITAGTAIRESMSILSSLKGTKVAATFVMVDRKEKGQTEKSAMAEVGEEYGFPVYSVVDVYDIIEYLEENPANQENVDRIKKYLAVNGAKE